jgi:4,5-DOPA dioxygenase extradiol
MRAEKMPVVFIGHGSPMNIIMDNDFTKSLVKLGSELPKPDAILVVSAHWLTEGTFVTCETNPVQIYDFYGFPRELYEYRYPAKGSSEAANETIQALRKCKVKCGKWGLDHASWAVLKFVYPEADVPVVELSLSVGMPAKFHYEMGRSLHALREKGVLIIGSGNIVHNLWKIAPETNADPYDWAVQFDALAKELILSGEHRKLIEYEKLGKNARLSVPTNDHYLPMLYILALQDKGDGVTFTHEGIQNGSVSMRSFIIK